MRGFPARSNVRSCVALSVLGCLSRDQHIRAGEAKLLRRRDDHRATSVSYDTPLVSHLLLDLAGEQGKSSDPWFGRENRLDNPFAEGSEVEAVTNFIQTTYAHRADKPFAQDKMLPKIMGISYSATFLTDTLKHWKDTASFYKDSFGATATLQCEKGFGEGDSKDKITWQSDDKKKREAIYLVIQLYWLERTMQLHISEFRLAYCFDPERAIQEYFGSNADAKRRQKLGKYLSIFSAVVNASNWDIFGDDESMKKTLLEDDTMDERWVEALEAGRALALQEYLSDQDTPAKRAKAMCQLTKPKGDFDRPAKSNILGDAMKQRNFYLDFLEFEQQLFREWIHKEGKSVTDRSWKNARAQGTFFATLKDHPGWKLKSTRTNDKGKQWKWEIIQLMRNYSKPWYDKPLFGTAYNEWGTFRQWVLYILIILSSPLLALYVLLLINRWMGKSCYLPRWLGCCLGRGWCCPCVRRCATMHNRRIAGDLRGLDDVQHAQHAWQVSDELAEELAAVKRGEQEPLVGAAVSTSPKPGNSLRSSRRSGEGNEDNQDHVAAATSGENETAERQDEDGLEQSAGQAGDVLRTGVPAGVTALQPGQEAEEWKESWGQEEEDWEEAAGSYYNPSAWLSEDSACWLKTWWYTVAFCANCCCSVHGCCFCCSWSKRVGVDGLPDEFPVDKSSSASSGNTNKSLGSGAQDGAEEEGGAAQEQDTGDNEELEQMSYSEEVLSGRKWHWTQCCPCLHFFAFFRPHDVEGKPYGYVFGDYDVSHLIDIPADDGNIQGGADGGFRPTGQNILVGEERGSRRQQRSRQTQDDIEARGSGYYNDTARRYSGRGSHRDSYDRYGSRRNSYDRRDPYDRRDSYDGGYRGSSDYEDRQRRDYDDRRDYDNRRSRSPSRRYDDSPRQSVRGELVDDLRSEGGPGSYVDEALQVSPIQYTVSRGRSGESGVDRSRSPPAGRLSRGPSNRSSAGGDPVVVTGSGRDFGQRRSSHDDYDN